MGLEQYHIVEVIGEGVSATVYKAVDTTTGSVVALKVLSPRLHADPVSVERFKREIQITRLLGHPQIVSIYDLIHDGERTCLVMEYLQGKNLKAFVAANHPLAIETVVAILRQVLSILSVCHAKNVIHRDLKPQNLIIDGNQLVRLVDFGIAKMTTLSDLTQTNTSIGSPEYMAPELFASPTFDPRSDIYALGIIAFELLAGAPPFRGDSLAMLYNQHRNIPVPSLSERRREVPDWLQQVIERMLAKRPHERYQSADEALADLEHQRVLARAIPGLKSNECLQCGQQTLAELPVCLHCGHNAPEALTSGDYDVTCNREEDDAKLEEFLQSVFGATQPLRRQGRTLLVTGLDKLGAELIKRSAHQHRIALGVQAHSPFMEFRKAAALVLTSFVVSCIVWMIKLRPEYHGPPGPFAVAAMFAVQASVVGVWIAVAWYAAQRFQRIEVEPVFPAQDVLRRRLTRDYGWLRRLVPCLTPERSAAMKVFVAQLTEKYYKLQRFGLNIDRGTTDTLESLLESSARLATVVSEIEMALQAPVFTARLQRYASLEQQVRSEDDPAQRAALMERCQALHEEVTAYCRLEERHGELNNRLVALQALFNRLLGRVLVFHAPVDRATRDLLMSSRRTLADDLVLSREINAELVRLQ